MPPPPPPSSLGFAKIRLVWRGGGRGRKRENGLKGLNHWPAKLQRGAIDEFNGRKTHPECRHMMARDQSRRREGTRLSGVCGGEEGRAGWSGGRGGSWEDRFLLPWEETLFSNGFRFGCRQPDALKHLARRRSGGRNFMIKKRRRFVSKGAISQSQNKSGTFSKRHIFEENDLGALLSKFQVTEALTPEVANLNGQQQITKPGPSRLERASGWCISHWKPSLCGFVHFPSRTTAVYFPFPFSYCQI